MSEQMRNNDMERVQKALDTLAEHFDSVHIFCTRHEGGQLGATVKMSMGVGNWFARYGQIREWLLIEEESSRSQCRDKDAS